MQSLNIQHLLHNIQNSTQNLKNVPLISSQNNRLHFLTNIAEQNLGLQKINQKINSASILKKGNPFFFIRKNYKKLFTNILKHSFLTPNLLKFLHMAYWPKNTYNSWRMFYAYHNLELIQRKNYKQSFISNLSYFFSLIFKKSNFSFLSNLVSSHPIKQKFYKKLFYYYNLNLPKFKANNTLKLNKLYLAREKLKFKKFSSKLKKKYLDRKHIHSILPTFKYIQTPKFIMKNRIKKEFKLFFLLTFKQRSFLKNLITFYFPVLSLNVKETTIHSLPMKTKKPRRV